MKAVRCDQHGVKVVSVDRPPRGILVRVAAAGICGTDLKLVNSTTPPRVTLGHELSGWLVDGTPVAIEPLCPCEQCPQCVGGAYNLCSGAGSGSSMDICLGLTILDGGMAEYVSVPARCIVPLPEQLAVSDACLVEPLAVALHGVARARVTPGQRGVVVGGGTVGLCAAAALRIRGAEASVVARYEFQSEAAEALGARPVAGAYDIAIDAVGTPAATHQAADLLRPGGVLLLLGIHTGSVGLDSATVAVRELTLVGSVAYAIESGTRDIDNAARVLAREPNIATALITHRFPINEAKEAFRTAADRSTRAIKVVIEPST